VNVFPGELNAIEPVVAVKVKSSFKVIFKSLPAIVTAPERVISDPTVVFASRVKVPLEVLEIVVSAACDKVPAEIVPDFNVVIEEVELFV
jgi:hypothetical protein